MRITDLFRCTRSYNNKSDIMKLIFFKKMKYLPANNAG